MMHRDYVTGLWEEVKRRQRFLTVKGAALIYQKTIIQAPVGYSSVLSFYGDTKVWKRLHH